MRSIKIGILVNIDSHGGGSHQWTINILHALEFYRRTHSGLNILVLYYPNYGEIEFLERLFPSFRYEKIGGRKYLLTRILRRLCQAFPKLIRLFRSRLFPLNRVLRQHAADCILFPVTVLDSALCNIPNVFFLADVLHRFYPNFLEIGGQRGVRLRDLIFGCGMNNAKLIVVESQQLRADLQKMFGIELQKFRVVQQILPRYYAHEMAGASPSVRASALEQPYFFYPAQLWEHKNHANLLHAMALLAPKYRDIKLVLAGSRKSGDEKIFELVEKLGLKDRVTYLGYVPDADMPTLYRRAAALVMPTFCGPTNIPTLEAFHFGCPALISDLAGVTEQTGHLAALRFDPSNPADIAEKLETILNDRDLMSRMIEAGKERLGVLSYENYCAALFRVFDEIIAFSVGPGIAHMRQGSP